MGIKIEKVQVPEHTKEFLGGNFWGKESYYWDAKEGKYYYISVDKSGWDENGWKYQEVTKFLALRKEISGWFFRIMRFFLT